MSYRAKPLGVLSVWLTTLALLLTACEPPSTSDILPSPTPPSTESMSPLTEHSMVTPVIETEPLAMPVSPTLKTSNVIAFVSDRREKNNLDIWILDMETEQPEAITTTADQDWHPLWSPDGQKLAYLSAANREDVFVVVVEFETRTVTHRQYMPDVVDFSWASDSQSLWLDTRSGIWQYNLPDDTVTQPINAGRFIVESGNGEFIATGVQKSAELYIYDLLIQDREGVALPTRFSRELEMVSINDLAWAHEEPRLATTFLPIRRQYSGGLSILVDSGQGFEEVATISPQETALSYCLPAWSPLDDYISYVVAWHYAELPCLGDVYVATSDLSQTFHISDNAIVTQQPWSPTNHEIIYARDARSPWRATSRSFRFAGEGSIWLSTVDGSEQRLVTDGDWYDGEAVWRPLNTETSPQKRLPRELPSHP